MNRQKTGRIRFDSKNKQKGSKSSQSSFSQSNKQNENSQSINGKSQMSIDTPIKRMRSQKKSSQKQQDNEDLIPGILKAAAHKRKQLQQSLSNKAKEHTGSTDHRQDESWSSDEVQDSSDQERKRAIQQKNISKIELGNQSVIQLPVEKISPNDSLDFGYGLEKITEASQTKQIPSDQNDMKSLYSIKSEKGNEASPKNFMMNEKSMTRDALLIPPSLQPQFKEDNKRKKDRKHSLCMTDSILSPRFQSYLGQSRHQHQLKLPSPMHQGRHSNHNQYPQVYRSDTYPRCQNLPYRTTFIKQELQLTLANNLDKILFKYSGGHARILYNNKLKIKNNSPINVEIKILCTSPSHYEVRPSSNALLQPSEIMDVIIQMKLYLHDLDHTTMKHDLSGYRKDMFKIFFIPCESSPQVWYEQGEKILPVVIQDTEEQTIRNQSLMKDLSNEQVKLAKGQKSIDMYRKMIEKTFCQMQYIDEQIKFIEKQTFYTRYFTKNIFTLVIMVGLGIGYLIG